jgi:hypothetical protein
VLGDPPDGLERPGKNGRTVPGVAGGCKRVVAVMRPGWCSSVAVPCRFSLCFQLTPGTKTEVPI